MGLQPEQPILVGHTVLHCIISLANSGGNYVVMLSNVMALAMPSSMVINMMLTPIIILAVFFRHLLAAFRIISPIKDLNCKSMSISKAEENTFPCPTCGVDIQACSPVQLV